MPSFSTRPPEGDRLTLDLEIEFEMETTSTEVSSEDAAIEVGNKLRDDLFHSLKRKFDGLDVLVGPPIGEFRHGSLEGVIITTLSAAGTGLTAVYGALRSPSFVQALWEGIIRRRFGRTVPITKFRARLRVQDDPQSLSRTPLREVWVEEPFTAFARRRPWTTVAGILFLALLIGGLPALLYLESDAQASAMHRRIDRLKDSVDALAQHVATETGARQIRIVVPANAEVQAQPQGAPAVSCRRETVGSTAAVWFCGP